MKGIALLVWFASNRNVAVGRPAGRWSAIRFQRRMDSSAISLVAARRAVGGTGAASTAVHYLDSLGSLQKVVGILTFA